MPNNKKCRFCKIGYRRDRFKAGVRSASGAWHHFVYCPFPYGVYLLRCADDTEEELEKAIGNWIDQAPMPDGLNGPVGDEAGRG